VSSCSIPAVPGAPALRFLQGWVRCCRYDFVLLHERRLRMRSWFPPFANCAKDGAPSFLFVPTRSKARANHSYLCFSFPFRSSGCPSLRFLQGGYGAACTMCLSCPADCIALTAPITCTLSPARATSACRFFDTARCRDRFPLDPGTEPPTLSIRRRGICGHAGAHPPARHRTGGGNTLHRMQVLKQRTAHALLPRQTPRPAPARPCSQTNRSAAPSGRRAFTTSTFGRPRNEWRS